MKITKSFIKQIIIEELSKLDETPVPNNLTPADQAKLMALRRILSDDTIPQQKKDEALRLAPANVRAVLQSSDINTVAGSSRIG